MAIIDIVRSVTILNFLLLMGEGMLIILWLPRMFRAAMIPYEALKTRIEQVEKGLQLLKDHQKEL